MAIAERWLAQHFNRPDFAVFDYDVYAMCGDGDMMEGVTSEAASLAGHLMLGNLCWIYDSNRITIEGHTDLAFSDDVAARFLAYGWNVERVGDANDTERIAQAIETFRRTHDVPTLIIVDSHIGYGAPHKHDTSAAHGEPLGEEEIRLAKRSYGWPEDAKFLVPDGVREHFRAGIGERGAAAPGGLAKRFAAYRAKAPGPRRPARADAEARASRRLGRRPAQLPRRLQRPCEPRFIRQGAERHRAALSLADRRLGRSRALDQDAPHLRGGRRFRGRQIRRPQSPLRHSRARHGRDPERPGAVEDPRLRLDLPDLLRLHEARRSA